MSSQLANEKDNVIPVNQNFQNISDRFVLICELIAAKIFGDKVSKIYDKTFQVLLIIPIISIFMLHNLFTLGIHRRPLMLSFEERGCQLIDSPFFKQIILRSGRSPRSAVRICQSPKGSCSERYGSWRERPRSDRCNAYDEKPVHCPSAS